MVLAKTIATSLGIGYINDGKGAGTVAAIACCIVWYLVPPEPFIWQWVWLVAIFFMGWWSGNVVEKVWGEDNSQVVIDEVSGMQVALLLIPVKLPYVIIGLVLFRFFDIVKPLGIRYFEKLPSGLGVMADDVVAGLYANIILQLVVWSKIV
jgi:phosphatidylglycerophosphatase A